MAGRLVLVGRAAGAFGVRGELRIMTYTQTPMALLAYRRLLREDGSPVLTLASARPARPGEIVARAEEIGDKTAADALRGLGLYVPREALPAVAGDDEFYLADLVNLRVETHEGQELGCVKAVLNHGAGDLLEIAFHSGATSRLIAFTRETVPVVDVAQGRLVVKLPAEVGEPEPRPGDERPAAEPRA